MSISILLVDDHKIMREGLRSMLEKQDGIKVVAEAEDGATAIKLAGELRVDMVIMDIAMPDMNGIEATQQIVEKHPDIKVVALSMHTERRFVAEMLKAGASGYLLKDSAFDELAHAIHIIHEGKTYLSPGITGVLVEDYMQQLSGGGNSASSQLSAREREVLQLIAEGLATKEIARRLDVSVKTIETHRHNIMNKLDIRSVAELTKYAIREGLTTLES
jgi:DNA-binding NarL/FixJ family response regulator